MREQLEERLASLKAELEAGERVLGDLEAKRASLRETPRCASAERSRCWKRNLAKARPAGQDASPSATDSAP
jgi:hypothetical protein